MSKPPRVSILIPCHNASPWIRQSIESALAQSYPEKEVIVIDDGSVDDSGKLIESFGDRVVFRRQAQSGGNVTRNRLTQFAQGEWLQYLDADDYLLPGKVASQMAALIGRPEVDVIYSPVIISDMNQSGDYVAEIGDDEDESLTFIRWGPLNTNGLLLRRAAILEVGGWKESQTCCQEHELFLRLIVAGRRFALHNKAESVYRLHGSQTVSRRDPLKVIRVRMQLTSEMETYLESQGRLTAHHRKSLFIARMECARIACSLDPDLARQLSAGARARGTYWVSSPALPATYQVMYRIAGFRFAERLASWNRARASRGHVAANSTPA